MKRRIRRIIASVLIILLSIMTLDFTGLIKLQDVSGDTVSAQSNTLGAGDWIYLDINNQASGWEDSGALTFFHYATASGSWTDAQMEEWSDNLYRVKIPADIASSGEFKFCRVKPDDIDNVWNWLPAGNTNLKLSDGSIDDSNTYAITGLSSGNYTGAWSSGTWNVSSYGGNALYFFNMGSTQLDSITAIFSVSDSDTAPNSIAMTAVSEITGLYSVTIPTGNGTTSIDYDTVSFKDSSGNTLAAEAIMNGSYEPSGNNTFYYGVTELADGSGINSWNVYPSAKSAIAGHTLYFDEFCFPVEESKTLTIQIGNGDEQTVSVDENNHYVYSYTISSEETATQRTILTVNYNDNAYHFLWSDLTKNVAAFTAADVLNVSDTYSTSEGGTRTIYFDATLSKLSYVGDWGDRGIPLADSDEVWCYAWGEGITAMEVTQMTKVAGRTIGQNTWSDVYKIEIDSRYTSILFCSKDRFGVNSDSTKTVDLTIPTDLRNPCFYADSSDDAGYKKTLRSGYWDEVYEIRDAETNKNTDVVDVDTGTFSYDPDILYLDTTLYDFYSDYELNGSNRDSYDSSVSVGTHRIYQMFRQFNQALSSYYENNSASSPLYWGNAQNFDGANFSEIKNAVNYYGSDNTTKFFYENNSMWDSNGNSLATGVSATLGLVSSSLVDGNLMLKTDEGETVTAPFFDADFIEGNNSKNTVLGEVYENVTFPFVKKKIYQEDNTGAYVEYWCFDSADQTAANKNLQLKYDEDAGYYLGSQTNQIKGSDSAGNATTDSNYFPFNTSSQSGNARTLNYGFGQKLEFTFRLTEDGTILASNETEVPIEFKFAGDDDVWIFIDGLLVLDVGGGHGKVTGTINFEDLESTISSVKNASGGGTTSNYTVSFPDALKNDLDFYNQEHTLTMYYMERGLWESNMYIAFSFPDENKLSVEKEVDTTDVNELFKEFFYAKPIFQFNIKNMATHYGSTEVNLGDEAKPKTYNDKFTSQTVEPSISSNTFTHTSSKDGRSDVVHWYANLTDSGGTYKDLRWGIVYPSTGKGTLMDVSEQSAYLQFKLYYDYTDSPSLSYMRIELEDASQNKIGGVISGKTYGSNVLTSNTWTTIQIDLSSFSGYDSFDFSQLTKIKFDYDYPRDFYLDDFVFKPAASSSVSTGFVVNEAEIPDYGSVKSGYLMDAVNALYTTANDTGETVYGRVDEDGNFSLASGQLVTFSNQFRTGSYIYLKENIDQTVFDVTWELYEDGQRIYNSTVPGTSTKVVGGETITGTGTAISDRRQEVYDDDATVKNKAYTETSNAKIDEYGNKTTDTLVFRSYLNPDSETTAIDLLVKQINKVKTGSIVVAKEAAEGSMLTGKYTIHIEFTNVAGMNLESNPIGLDIELAAGGSYEVTGIPAGTIYTITEVLPDDDSKLEEIIQGKDDSGNVLGNDQVLINGTTNVQGRVVADDEEATEKTTFTFVNSLTPSINLKIEKAWKESNGTTDITTGLPESIWVQIQRRAADESVFSPVTVDGKDVIEITPGYDGWVKQITSLEKYKDKDGSKPYTYKVVEMQMNDDGSYSQVTGSITIDGSEFNVSYGTDISLSAQNTTKDYSYTITNTRVEDFDLSFTKVKANGTGNDIIEKLTGAQFTLYEYRGTEKFESYLDVMKAIEEITADDTSWKSYELTEDNAVFSKEDLSRDYVYYLVETKVPDGMQDPGGCWEIKYSTGTGDNVHDNIMIISMSRTGDVSSMAAIGFLETKNANGVQGWFITNLEQWNVPTSGGMGNGYFYTAGICLMLVAAVGGTILLYRRKKDKSAKKA